MPKLKTILERCPHIFLQVHEKLHRFYTESGDYCDSYFACFKVALPCLLLIPNDWVMHRYVKGEGFCIKQRLI